MNSPDSAAHPDGPWPAAPRFSRHPFARIALALGAAVAVLAGLSGADAAEGPADPAAANGGSANTVQSQVVEAARTLAQESFKPPSRDLPEAIANLKVWQYQNIRYRNEQRLWRDNSLFSVEFLPRGFLYRDRVKIHAVEGGQIRDLPFDRDMFDYSTADIKPEEIPENLGFAGFRILYPLNAPNQMDEVQVFLGASYFRTLGRDQVYGLSARGLAIDTALPKGEEFPVFREFWLVRPEPGATSMTLYALLDSRSVTGAYRFDLHPGTGTVTEVSATLFAREDIQKLGLAPLTSMFLYGENNVAKPDNYRPEVHDSDGLLMRTGRGEWIWRPLVNPRALQVSALVDENPGGFGLMQRDRRFENFMDVGNGFERRPSLWVEPVGNTWGKGAVELVEIPSRSETNDNIVAYWVSEQAMAAGDSREFGYRLRTFSEPGTLHDLGRVERTLNGWAGRPETQDEMPRQLRRFVVDFEGGELRSLLPSQPVSARLSTSAGEISQVQVHKLPGGSGWRAAFMLTPDEAKPADMRLSLELRGKQLTETWSYVWSPNEVQ